MMLKSKEDFCPTICVAIIVMLLFSCISYPLIYEISVIPSFSRFVPIVGTVNEITKQYKLNDFYHQTKYYKTTFNITNPAYNIPSCDAFVNKDFYKLNSKHNIIFDISSIDYSGNSIKFDNGLYYKYANCLSEKPYGYIISMCFIEFFIGVLPLIISIGMLYTTIVEYNDLCKNNNKGYSTLNQHNKDSIKETELTKV